MNIADNGRPAVEQCNSGGLDVMSMMPRMAMMAVVAVLPVMPVIAVKLFISAIMRVSSIRYIFHLSSGQRQNDNYIIAWEQKPWILILSLKELAMNCDDLRSDTMQFTVIMCHWIPLFARSLPSLHSPLSLPQCLRVWLSVWQLMTKHSVLSQRNSDLLAIMSETKYETNIIINVYTERRLQPSGDRP